ncbi:MAG: Arginine--tRNA ligase [Alphaproteobacteria bacterium MarineAlpha9_Bin4]|nr:MAG: Arginine--tRNA ligase [Alphaproteobacteria bacterium MarineAlpha9_Bin4]
MNIYKSTKKIILNILHDNFKNLNKEIDIKITCEQPKKQKFGDVSTNVILVVSKMFNIEKKVLSEVLIKNILKNKIFKKVNYVDPGFLNINFSNPFWSDFFKKIYLNKLNYGFSNIGKNKKINIEFLSANPTGPLHIGHLRGAIFGDVLAKLLSKNGFNVTKEYYVNDLGVQVDNLAFTIDHHISNFTNKKDITLSEKMYKGEYLKKIAYDFFQNPPFDYKNFEKLKEYAVNSNMELIKKDLDSIGVSFNKYISEKNNHKMGLLQEVIEKLEKNNDIYFGSLEKPKSKNELGWKPIKQLLFRSSKYGDKSDRVVKKSNGDWTYFASDIAYHYNKVSRGYDEIINIWGADHAGYIDRVKASLNALGYQNTVFTVKLCQIVNLIDKKKVIKMSKRSGNFVLVSEILPKIGKDVLRFFMLTRKNDAHLDFDLEKCLNETNENPSFYVQYAYARISSLKKIAKQKNIKFDESHLPSIKKLVSNEELNIIREISLWPKIIESSVAFKEPHRIVYYLIELSGKFHAYWSLGKSNSNFKILSEDNSELTQARLLLLEMVQSVIRNGLEILTVSVKEKM